MTKFACPVSRRVDARLFTFLLVAVSVSFAERNVTPASRGTLQMPILFERNQGQVQPDVQFLARAGRYRLHLTKDAAILNVTGGKRESSNAVLRTKLVEANPNAQISGIDQQKSTTNYLVGPKSEWKVGVTHYSKVQYGAVYPGVDLIYYGTTKGLEYDFMVAPNADPAAIALEIEGADKISIDQDGSLLLETAAGKVVWRKPIAYQGSSRRRLVTASYRVTGNRVSFNLGNYDRHQALVIDPTLAYGTYIDGTDFDSYLGMQVDAAGFVYVLGVTDSADFPTTPGAYRRAINSTLNSQTFVSKLSQDGSFLVWSTIIGGSGPNNITTASGFTLDSSGNVYVVGGTSDATYSDTGVPTYEPSTFPTTPGAYNTNHLATIRYFLLKLNISGSALDYSTFLSDQPNVSGEAVVVGVAGNAFVTGTYNQAGGKIAPFPCTSGAFQCTYGGDTDGFVMKFNGNASQLLYATLIGGAKSDRPSQILVDTSGQATIAGWTYSPSFPITPNGKRQTDEGGFVTTFDTTGTALLYSTVLNHVFRINVKRDTAGNYYVGGSAGTNLPTTANAYQKSFTATGTDIHVGFLTVINSAGNLVYSSYVGGNPPGSYLEDTQVQLVSLSSVTVAGNRFNDTAFPVTDRTYEQDSCSFLATINPQASSGPGSLVYSGCTPINITNNLSIELFRGVLYFNGSRMFLDNNRHLYGLDNVGPTSSNAFQKAPPDPGSGDGTAHVWVGKYNLNPPGPGGINLSVPYQWGAPYNNFVLFRATARSPQCAAGIAAMRVYISPGVWANTTAGATLNAYVSFPSDGNYGPVIVAYDNCGHTFTRNDPILIQGTSGGTGSIGVTSPVNNTIVSNPVQFKANTQVRNCPAGIAAMRVYTAPGVNAYTVNASSIDKQLTLSPGTHNTVIQAWDNCGRVYQAPVNITVR